MPQYRGTMGWNTRTSYVQVTSAVRDRSIRVEVVEEDGTNSNPNPAYGNSYLSPEVALTLAVDLHRQATALLERERRAEEAARRQPARQPATTPSTESGDNRAYWQDVLDPEDYQRIFGV